MKNNKTSLKYQCKIFDVWEEEYDLPDGRSTRQSWINHNPTVAIVAINGKNELLVNKTIP
jgi:ADP-ribose pyrophosphatase